MRVAFFGTPDFAVPSLEALRADGVEIAAVVTPPDRPRTRSHSTLLPCPVKAAAAAAGLPVLQPERPRDPAFLDALRALDLDLGVVVAYGHLLRPELLAIPRLGFVNVHASLLPRWRGAAPIHWAVLSGDPMTGVAIMRVEEGLDTGGTWQMVETPIGPTDTTGELFTRLAELGAHALVDALPAIARGEAPVPQDDARATHAPKVDRATARIRWDETATQVSCRIRAMDPAPGAWSTWHGEDVKFFSPTVLPGEPSTTPGRFQEGDRELRIQCGQGEVRVAIVQPAGRRRMAAGDWLRGLDPDLPRQFG
ncbi:MAG: methionyl-tRNA formyltransferase [Gemmatimonadetes bacterium]|nr:methionyl-tRNA formyltransferase [Gemmatimonadota bacterium]